MNSSLYIDVIADPSGDLRQTWDRAETKAVAEDRRPLVKIEGDSPWRGSLFLIHEADLRAISSRASIKELDAALGV